MFVFAPKDVKIWLNTPLGCGLLIGVESFSQDNSQWTVALQKDGQIRHFSTLQVNLAINHTDEINLKDVYPTKP